MFNNFQNTIPRNNFQDQEITRSLNEYSNSLAWQLQDDIPCLETPNSSEQNLSQGEKCFRDFLYSKVLHDVDQTNYDLNSQLKNFLTEFDYYPTTYQTDHSKKAHDSTLERESFLDDSNSTSCGSSQIIYDSPLSLEESISNDDDDSEFEAPTSGKKTKKRSKESSFYSYPSKKQNRKKNLQGLIAMKVKSAIKNDDSFYAQEKSRLGISGERERRLKQFANNFDKKNKTWNSITVYFEKDQHAAEDFLNLIFAILADRNAEYYEKWLKEGKTYEKNKIILRDEKDSFVVGFQDVQYNLLNGEKAEMRNAAKRVRR